MGLMDMLFGDNNSSIKEALEKGGSIVDVRTPGEFAGGKVKGSINIPLDQLQNKEKKINSLKKPIILVCASGSRSASAKQMLKSSGIDDVLNGGSWNKIDHVMSEI